MTENSQSTANSISSNRMTQANSRIHYGPLYFNLIYKSVMTCVNTTSYQFGRMCMVSFFALCLLFDLGGFLCFALLCLKSIHDDDTQHKFHHPVTASKWFRLVRCTKNFSFPSIFFAISILENETKIDTRFPRSLAPFDSALSTRRCFQLHAMEHERSHVSMSYQRHTHTFYRVCHSVARI